MDRNEAEKHIKDYLVHLYAVENEIPPHMQAILDLLTDLPPPPNPSILGLPKGKRRGPRK